MKDKKDLSRREFLKKLSMVIGAGLVAPALFTEGSGVAEAKADGKCGTSYSCTGGGGKCGSSYECGGGGGKCGSSYECTGR